VWDEVWIRNPNIDSLFYHKTALEILEQGFFTPGDYFLFNPGFPWYLAAVYSVLGTSIENFLIFQWLMGALTGVIVYFIAVELFGRENRIPLIAGLIYATYGFNFFHEGVIVKVAALNFLNASMILLILKGRRSDYFWGGVLFSISYAIRSNLLFFGMFLGVGSLIYFYRNRKKTALKPILVRLTSFFLPFALLLLLFGIRNLNVVGEFKIGPKNSGGTLYVANRPDFSGSWTPVSWSPSGDPLRELRDWHIEAEKRLGTKLSDDEVNDYWMGEFLDYATSQPFHLLWNDVKKGVNFFATYEIPINLDFNPRRDEYFVLNFPGWFMSWGILVALGLTGMIFFYFFHKGGGRRENTFERLVPGLYFTSYFAGFLLLHVVAEYRAPLIPIFAVFGALSLHSFYSAIRGMKKKRKNSTQSLVRLSVPFLASVLMTFASYGIVVEGNYSHSYFQTASLYNNEGRTSDALKELEKCFARSPEHPDARILAININFKAGNYEEAYRHVQTLLGYHPNHRGGKLEQARLLALGGGASQALQILATIKFKDKDQINEKRLITSIALAKQKKFQETWDYINKIYEEEGVLFDPLKYNMAEMSLQLGKTKEFLFFLNDYIRTNPDNVRALRKRAKYYLGIKDMKRAEEDARKVLSISPTDRRALKIIEAIR